MLTIIDLDSKETEYIIEVMKNLGESFIVSSDESRIIKSERVVLCASPDIGEAVRNLHILNLFTVLRLCRRPLLGIGPGLHLMGGNFTSGKDSGVGIFPFDVLSFAEKSFSGGMHKMKINKPGKLLDGIPDEENFWFLGNCYLEPNKFTSAGAEINNLKITAAIEDNNFMGIQFCPGRSGRPGEKIIENFLSIPF